MKKVFRFTSLFLLAALVSACGQTAPVPDLNPVSNIPVYYGDWTIQSVVASTPISAPADESMIGMKATYSKEKAALDQNEIVNPEYKEQEMTNDDFFNQYRNQLSDIGISSDTVQTVEIRNWTNAGNFMMIKDDQTMIFLWDGSYYEMKRDE